MRRKISRWSWVVGFSLRRVRPLSAVLLSMFALAASALQAPDAAYVQSFEKWKAEMVDDLKQRWLPLAGLFWLKPGANSFGTADDSAIVLPSGPAHAGSFTLNGGDVSVQFAAGTPAKIDNKPVSEASLQSDITGKPTVIELGSLRMFVITRGTRIGIRVRDLNSDRVRNYKGPVFSPLDLDYRVTGEFVPSNGKKIVDIPNVLGDVTPTPSPGEVHFKLRGQELTLTALSGDTYPGGRFLDTDPVVDGKVVLDFNRAYNPPCAVTPYATCPLAPKENRLAVAIEAGEKYDRTHGHK
jgi:uncharacterized protein